jgi:hypothetical protein
MGKSSGYSLVVIGSLPERTESTGMRTSAMSNPDPSTERDPAETEPTTNSTGTQPDLNRVAEVKGEAADEERSTEGEDLR